jgi:hypothetical protein
VTGLRYLQVYFSSALLIAVIILLTNTVTEIHWRFDERLFIDMGVLLLVLTSTFALIASMALNLRLLRNCALRIDLPTKSLPQVGLLVMSVAVLGVVARQDIRVFVHFDAHLSQYGLAFLLSDDFLPNARRFHNSIAISGDGTQVVIFLFGLLTINVTVAMYNTGMLAHKWAVDESVLSKILVNAHIGAGSLISLIALLGFFSFYLQIQSFANALEFDPAVMNSSNIARLTYVFLSFTFLALYAQWIFRDGIKSDAL